MFKCGNLAHFQVKESLVGLKEATFGSGSAHVPMDRFRQALLDRATDGRLHGMEGEVKCIIALSNSFEIPHTLFLLQEIGRRTGRQFAVGGANGYCPRSSSDQATAAAELSQQQQQPMLGPNTVADDEDMDEDGGSTVGLIFAGSGVKSASVLVPSGVRTASKMEPILATLKRAGLDERNSCAFMFACCGRGAGLYLGKKNVESAAFRKLFPNTPLIGLFGNGEIGMAFIPEEEAPPPPRDTLSDPGASKRQKTHEQQQRELLVSSDDVLHSYTTVFVMLSFHSSS